MTLHDLQHFFDDDLKLCGCGSPWSAAILIRDILRLCPLCEHQSQLAALFHGSDGIEQIILSSLDNAGIIEHGGSLGGSWLTDKGSEILSALNKFAASEEDAETNLFLSIDDEKFFANRQGCPKCRP